MYPVLLEIGDFQLHSYGALGAVGFLVLVFIAMGRARRFGLNGDAVVDVIFWGALAGLVGARGAYVIQNPAQFETFLDIVNIRGGGLVFYGALIIGMPVGSMIMLRKKLPFFALMDMFACAFPFGHVLTRTGCFLAGCCYGDPTDVPWAVSFTDPMSAIHDGIARHPTQLYEVGYLLAIGLLLNWFYSRKRFHGQVMLGYLVLYATLRSINEIFRGDITRGYFLESVLGQTLSFSQGISLGVAVVAGILFFVIARRVSTRPNSEITAGDRSDSGDP